MVDKESVFYVPAAVNAMNHLNNRPNLPDVLSWQPNFALLAKSLDWGVTSGPMAFQKMGFPKCHGQYLTVWRRDKKNRWKVRLRAQVENDGKSPKADLVYYEPDGSDYLKQRSKARLEQREEMVMQIDRLFSTVLKTDNEVAFRKFLTDDVRYYYPGEGEIEGRENVLAFLKRSDINIRTEPTEVGRAHSGEYAYTSGTATVRSKEKETKFGYIRVWQLKNDYQWWVLLEMMFER